eukprot:ANDGO_06839.mRNA.1 hypothetical protein
MSIAEIPSAANGSRLLLANRFPDPLNVCISDVHHEDIGALSPEMIERLRSASFASSLPKVDKSQPASYSCFSLSRENYIPQESAVAICGRFLDIEVSNRSFYQIFSHGTTSSSISLPNLIRYGWGDYLLEFEKTYRRPRFDWNPGEYQLLESYVQSRDLRRAFPQSPCDLLFLFSSDLAHDKEDGAYLRFAVLQGLALANPPSDVTRDNWKSVRSKWPKTFGGAKMFHNYDARTAYNLYNSFQLVAEHVMIVEGHSPIEAIHGRVLGELNSGYRSSYWIKWKTDVPAHFAAPHMLCLEELDFVASLIPGAVVQFEMRFPRYTRHWNARELRLMCEIACPPGMFPGLHDLPPAKPLPATAAAGPGPSIVLANSKSQSTSSNSDGTTTESASAHSTAGFGQKPISASLPASMDSLLCYRVSAPTLFSSTVSHLSKQNHNNNNSSSSSNNSNNNATSNYRAAPTLSTMQTISSNVTHLPMGPPQHASKVFLNAKSQEQPLQPLASHDSRNPNISSSFYSYADVATSLPEHIRTVIYPAMIAFDGPLEKMMSPDLSRATPTLAALSKVNFVSDPIFADELLRVLLTIREEEQKAIAIRKQQAEKNLADLERQKADLLKRERELEEELSSTKRRRTELESKVSSLRNLVENGSQAAISVPRDRFS